MKLVCAFCQTESKSHTNPNGPKGKRNKKGEWLCENKALCQSRYRKWMFSGNIKEKILSL